MQVTLKNEHNGMKPKKLIFTNYFSGQLLTFLEAASEAINGAGG